MKEAIVKYFDSRLNSRGSFVIDVPDGYVDKQVLYLFKKRVGYGYKESCIRDISVSYVMKESSEKQLSMFD